LLPVRIPLRPGASLPNLREEVYKTENYDCREELKRREAVVKDLLARLAPEP